MLEMSKYTNTVVADNTLTINGAVIGKISDALAQKIITAALAEINGTSTPAKSAPSTKLSVPEDRKEHKPMVGKKLWQEDWVTVTDNDGEFRVYLEVPHLVRKKGEADNKKAKQRADFIRNKLKEEFKDMGAVWGGDFDNGDIFWVFPNKTTTNKYIKARKKYAAEKEAAAK